MDKIQEIPFPSWMNIVLKAAGIYNIIWGILIVVFPLEFFIFADIPVPNYPEIWQCVGMIVGVYGIGYYIASINPYKHWPVILVGFLGKLFGPIGAVYYAWLGKFPWSFLIVNVFNDLIWLIPFTIILYKGITRDEIRKVFSWN